MKKILFLLLLLPILGRSQGIIEFTDLNGNTVLVSSTEVQYAVADGSGSTLVLDGRRNKIDVQEPLDTLYDKSCNLFLDVTSGVRHLINKRMVRSISQEGAGAKIIMISGRSISAPSTAWAAVLSQATVSPGCGSAAVSIINAEIDTTLQTDGVDTEEVWKFTRSDASVYYDTSSVQDIENHGNVLYVATTGNNATAIKGNPHFPWRDPWTASIFMVDGDAMHVFPGTYTASSNDLSTDFQSTVRDSFVINRRNNDFSFYAKGAKFIFSHTASNVGMFAQHDTLTKVSIEGGSYINNSSSRGLYLIFGDTPNSNLFDLPGLGHVDSTAIGSYINANIEEIFNVSFSCFINSDISISKATNDFSSFAGWSTVNHTWKNKDQPVIDAPSNQTVRIENYYKVGGRPASHSYTALQTHPGVTSTCENQTIDFEINNMYIDTVAYLAANLELWNYQNSVIRKGNIRFAINNFVSKSRVDPKTIPLVDQTTDSISVANGDLYGKIFRMMCDGVSIDSMNIHLEVGNVQGEHQVFKYNHSTVAGTAKMNNTNVTVEAKKVSNSFTRVMSMDLSQLTSVSKSSFNLIIGYHNSLRHSISLGGHTTPFTDSGGIFIRNSRLKNYNSNYGNIYLQGCTQPIYLDNVVLYNGSQGAPIRSNVAVNVGCYNSYTNTPPANQDADVTIDVTPLTYDPGVK